MGEPITWRELEKAVRDFEAVEKEAAANLAESRRLLTAALADIHSAAAAERAGSAVHEGYSTRAALDKLQELRGKLVTRALDAEAMAQDFDRTVEEKRLISEAGQEWVDLQSGTRSVRAVGDYRLAVQRGPLGVEWKMGIVTPTGEVEVMSSGRGATFDQAKIAADNAAMTAAERGGPSHPGVELGTPGAGKPLKWYKPADAPSVGRVGAQQAQVSLESEVYARVEKGAGGWAWEVRHYPAEGGHVTLLTGRVGTEAAAKSKAVEQASVVARGLSAGK